MVNKAFMIVLLTIISIHNMIPFHLPYGTNIKTIKTKDYLKRDILFPGDDAVTTVLFFNINNKYHHNIISQLNYLIINLQSQNVRFKVICISKGDLKDFQKLDDQLHLECYLINDKKNKISDIFNTSCNGCLQLFIIDKSSILRYFSSQYDSYFVREIVERYSRK